MSSVRFRERHRPLDRRVPLAVTALFVPTLGWSSGAPGPAVLIAGGLFLALVSGLALVSSTIVVDDDGLRVRLVPRFLSTVRIPASRVIGARPGERRADPAGRPGVLPSRRLAAAFGDRTVRVERTDGSPVYVGTSRPVELVAALFEAVGAVEATRARDTPRSRPREVTGV